MTDHRLVSGRYITSAEASKLLGFAPKKLYQMFSDGLQALKKGNVFCLKNSPVPMPYLYKHIIKELHEKYNDERILWYSEKEIKDYLNKTNLVTYSRSSLKEYKEHDKTLYESIHLAMSKL
jgi:hypothetical protein